MSEDPSKIDAALVHIAARRFAELTAERVMKNIAVTPRRLTLGNKASSLTMGIVTSLDKGRKDEVRNILSPKNRKDRRSKDKELAKYHNRFK